MGFLNKIISNRTFVSILFTIIMAACVTVTSVHTQAAELDTHFYRNYQIARLHGFTNEYALFAATMAQWVDEGFSSTPMATVLLRRLWHFPTYRFLPKRVTQDGFATFRPITVAEPNHPVAYKLFDEGLRSANWSKIFLAVHVVEDSFTHAGYTDSVGHAAAGHWPDRAWADPVKYLRMVRQVNRMFYATKLIAPDEALEPWARNPDAQNMKADLQKINELTYAALGPNIGRNYFKDPRFTPVAVRYIANLAKAKGFLAQSFDIDIHLPRPEDYLLSPEERIQTEAYYQTKYLKELKIAGLEMPWEEFKKLVEYDLTRKDAWRVLSEWVVTRRRAEIAKGILYQDSIFNLEQLDMRGLRGLREQLIKIESSTQDPLKRKTLHDEMVSDDQLKEIVDMTVRFLIGGELPHVLDSYNHSVFESDDGLRQLELALKIGDIREEIYQAYERNILFDPNTKIHRANNKALAKDIAKTQALDRSLFLTVPLYEPELLSTKDVEVVTLNKKNQWGTVLVKANYYWRSLFDDILDGLPIMRKITDGKHSLKKHAAVRDFEIGEVLKENIANKNFKLLGPISDITLTGVSNGEQPSPRKEKSRLKQGPLKIKTCRRILSKGPLA